jgi:Fe-S oxidoreductase
VDRKLLEARLNLARHFLQHVVRRFFSTADKDGVGLSQFLAYYRDDNIYELQGDERTRYPSFSRCIQCDICQPYCVMYRALDQQQFPGPMVVASTLSRPLAELDTTIGVIYNCTMCRRCETVCPENAPVAEMVAFVRKYINKCAPDLVPQPLRERCETIKRCGTLFDQDPPDILTEKSSAEYVLFLGCQSRFKQNRQAEAAISMLKRLGIDFTVIDELCCGAPLTAIGCDDGGDLARTNLKRIREKKTSKVITLCPHCLVTFCEGREYAGRIEPIHIAELLPQLHPASAGREPVAYHDSCMLGRVCGVYDPPRLALSQVGARIVEMEDEREHASCCGNWGALGYSARATAEALATRRLEDARNAGAEVLLTECPWCLDIFASAPMSGDKPRVRSVVEYLQNPEL